MRFKLPTKYAVVLLYIVLLGCSNPTILETPQKIGNKERTQIILGQKAAHMVNRMHGLSVAPEANVIAEYGSGESDVLYISRYSDMGDAKEALDLMVGKIAAAKKGPFFHLMQIKKYKNEVYITLGMGAVHYIYVSDNFLLWVQTYQSFGTALPPQLLKLYPTEK